MSWQLTRVVTALGMVGSGCRPWHGSQGASLLVAHQMPSCPLWIYIQPWLLSLVWNHQPTGSSMGWTCRLSFSRTSPPHTVVISSIFLPWLRMQRMDWQQLDAGTTKHTTPSKAPGNSLGQASSILHSCSMSSRIPGKRFALPKTLLSTKQRKFSGVSPLCCLLIRRRYAEITKARDEHLASVTPVPNQNGRGSSSEFAFCSDPHSQEKYPDLENCTMNPSNWQPASICNTVACMTANPDFKARCKPKTCPGPQCPPVPASNYLGCYVDHTNGVCDLPHIVSGHCANQKSKQVPGMTVELCNALCPANYSYFGVQHGGTGCFCGNAYGSQGHAALQSCNQTCANTEEPCGGDNLNSVYRKVPAN